jgi:apolipoprotein N-acyltransferase
MEQIQRDIGVNLLLSENRTEDLIIWSETSIALMENQALSLISQLDKEFKNKKQGLIFGIPTGDLEGDYFNSVIAVGDAEGRYSKEHLLPFGEYIPLKSIFSIFSKFVDMPLGGFARGDKKQKPILIKGVPAGSSICFEGAFGRVLRRSIPEAQFLINVSNDGWFSGSNASFQHLEMQQFRALELGRELARATTDGISAFINHKGEIKAKTNNGEKIVLSGEIQPREGITPYARLGNLLIMFLLLIYSLGIKFSSLLSTYKKGSF